MTLSDSTWNPDGSLASRVGATAGTASFTYDWAGRLAGVSHSAAYTGSITSAWRLDGLLGSRAWPNSEAATSAYDAADRLRTLTPPAATFAASFTFDALGRIATRSVATTPTAIVDTYDYAATAETVARITTTGGTSATLTSVVDPAGSRLTTSTGSVAYALPDLHGSTAVNHPGFRGDSGDWIARALGARRTRDGAWARASRGYRRPQASSGSLKPRTRFAVPP